MFKAELHPGLWWLGGGLTVTWHFLVMAIQSPTLGLCSAHIKGQKESDALAVS